ncbi:MAG: replication initiation protein, partial [Betaproteobacteria bacterium]
YTKILLEMGAQMRSYGAAVLFELGMQYLTSPSRLTMREDVFWWASVLTGRSDIDKVDYRYFKRDVLQRALVEVDALQNEFSLELIEHREGRRVAELQFLVHRKIQPELNVTEARNTFDLVLIERMRKLGLKDEEADRLYTKTDEALLRSTLDHVEQRQRHTALAPLAAPAAYFRDALKKGYAALTRTGGARRGTAPPRGTTKRVPVKASIETIRAEWERAQANAAEKHFAGQGREARDELQREFEASQLASIMEPIAKAWRRDGPASKIAGPIFFRWLAARSWASEPSDKDLLEFAVAKGTFDSL